MIAITIAMAITITTLIAITKNHHHHNCKITKHHHHHLAAFKSERSPSSSPSTIPSDPSSLSDKQVGDDYSGNGDDDNNNVGNGDDGDNNGGNGDDSKFLTRQLHCDANVLRSEGVTLLPIGRANPYTTDPGNPMTLTSSSDLALTTLSSTLTTNTSTTNQYTPNPSTGSKVGMCVGQTGKQANANQPSNKNQVTES